MMLCSASVPPTVSALVDMIAHEPSLVTQASDADEQFQQNERNAAFSARWKECCIHVNLPTAFIQCCEEKVKNNKHSYSP